MKISTDKLKQLIQEEIENLMSEEVVELLEEGPVVQQQQGEKPVSDQPLGSSEEKVQSDVSTVLKYIDKINNPIEYMQLLKSILDHNVRNKQVVLRKLLPVYKSGLQTK